MEAVMNSSLPLVASLAEQLQESPVDATKELRQSEQEAAIRRRRHASGTDSSESGRKALEDVDVHFERAFTEADISTHQSADDAWVVVDGVVYDISHFVDTHPGGAEVIVEHLQSKDIGNFMRGKEPGAAPDTNHSHSQYAFRMLQQFRIGRVRDYNSKRGEINGSLQPSSASEGSRYTVDLNKPLVFQVGKLGADYDQWVHDPIVQKDPPRFFESDVAEFFTRTAWWVIPAVWGPLVIFMAMAACKNGLWLSALPFSMAAGAFIWTFIEYLLHRFVFHMKTSGYWTNTAHYFLHGFHHKHPMDGTRLVFPPAITGIIVTMIWYVTEPVGWILGRPMKLSMFSGGLLMYIIYDVTHYFLHFGTPFSKSSQMLKRFHLNHHFRDQTNSYGVTSPFWDTVFDTFPEQANKILGARRQ